MLLFVREQSSVAILQRDSWFSHIEHANFWRIAGEWIDCSVAKSSQYLTDLLINMHNIFIVYVRLALSKSKLILGKPFFDGPIASTGLSRLEALLIARKNGELKEFVIIDVPSVDERYAVLICDCVKSRSIQSIDSTIILIEHRVTCLRDNCQLQILMHLHSCLDV